MTVFLFPKNPVHPEMIVLVLVQQKSATPTLTRNVSKTIHFVKLVIVIDLENWKFSRRSELSFF